MKRITVALAVLLINSYQAQFKVNVEAPASFSPNEVYLYTLNGSKDMLNSKENKKGNTWQIKVDKPYTGMMKLYFPEINASINFISENKEVKLKLDTESNKITNIDYLDEANFAMNQNQDIQQKKEYILPALYQIKEYYKNKSDFGTALSNEVLRLSNVSGPSAKFPFVEFYNANYSKFVEKSAVKKASSHEEIIDFFTKANDMLESSSLMRPILVNYLNIGPSTNLTADLDNKAIF